MEEFEAFHEGLNVNGVNRLFREVLRARGFVWCDDGAEPADDAAGPLELDQPLELRGLGASSTDHPSQSVEATEVDDDHSFWSSTGSAGPEEDEWLEYRVAAALAAVRFVQLRVFRAAYQFGEPVYPPTHVSFQTGAVLGALGPPSMRYAVRPDNSLQTFALPASTPLGRFLRVNLHGKRQRQLQDMRWYTAIGHVAAHGSVLSAAQLARLRDFTLGEGSVYGALIPTYACSEALETAAEASADKMDDGSAAADGQQLEQRQRQWERPLLEAENDQPRRGGSASSFHDAHENP